MSLMELADDLWARFCRMNDHMQVIWLEKYAERPVHIVLMQDINKYLDEKYNRDYVAFYKRINSCDWWDVDKKWFIDYLDCNAMSSDDTLTAEAWTNTNLLSKLTEKAFCRVLGYTDDEIKNIQAFISSLEDDEITTAWNEVMQTKVIQEVKPVKRN